MVLGNKLLSMLRNEERNAFADKASACSTAEELVDLVTGEGLPLSLRSAQIILSAMHGTVEPLSCEELSAVTGGLPGYGLASGMRCPSCGLPAVMPGGTLGYCPSCRNVFLGGAA